MAEDAEVETRFRVEAWLACLAEERQDDIERAWLEMLVTGSARLDPPRDES